MPAPRICSLRRLVPMLFLWGSLLWPPHTQAQFGVRVIDLDFSGAERVTVVLFERPNHPGEYLISAGEIPTALFIEGALDDLPRFSEGGCDKCIPVAALGGVQFNEKDASGLLRIHPHLLTPQALYLSSQSIAQEVQSRTGLMLNWGARGARRDIDGLADDTRYAGDLGLIASLGPAGVLRHDGIWLEDFGWRRGSTSLEFFSIKNRFLFTLGDTVSASGPLSSGLRLGGLSLRRRFDTQPGRIFTPAYDLSTVSSLPGIAELYIDGERRRRQKVNAGEVTFEDIQGSNGSNVTLRFVDELGAVQEVSTQLLGLNRMIGQGEWDYDFTAGALRQDENDYADPGAAFNVRYGITNWLNTEIFSEAVENQYNGALGLTLALPFAVIDLSASRNYYPQSVDDPLPLREGEAYTWSITNTAVTQRSLFTYGYEGRKSNNFRRLGQSDLLAEFQRVYVGTSVGRFGLSASASRIDDANTYGLSASTRLGRFTLRAGASKVERGGSAGFVGISWSPSRDGVLRQTSLLYGHSETLDSAAVSATLIDVDRRALADFRAENVQTIGKPRRSDSFGQALLSKQWRAAHASYNYRDDGSLRTQSLGVNGGITFSGVRPNFVQRINSNDGYLVVETGVPGVLIDHGGYSHQTDSRGKTSLLTRGFSPTRYQVEVNSLPEGYSYGHDLKTTSVVPGTRGISRVELAAPGFLLLVNGAKDGELVRWNGEAYPIFGIGAYIEDARVGENQLTWREKRYTVSLPPIGSDIPEFEFEPKTGRLERKSSP